MHTGVIGDKCTTVVDQDFAKILPSLDLLLLQSLSTPFMITFHKNTDDDDQSKNVKVVFDVINLLKDENTSPQLKKSATPSVRWNQISSNVYFGFKLNVHFCFKSNVYVGFK